MSSSSSSSAPLGPGSGSVSDPLSHLFPVSDDFSFPPLEAPDPAFIADLLASSSLPASRQRGTSNNFPAPLPPSLDSDSASDSDDSVSSVAEQEALIETYARELEQLDEQFPEFAIQHPAIPEAENEAMESEIVSPEPRASSRKRVRSSASSSLASAGPSGASNLMQELNADLDSFQSQSKRGRTRTRGRPKLLAQKLTANQEKLMGEINGHYLAGNYQTAIQLIKTLLKQAPKAPGPYHTLGLIYEATGNDEKALHAFLCASQFSSQTDFSLLEIVARMAFDQQQYKQALFAVRKILLNRRLESPNAEQLDHLEYDNYSIESREPFDTPHLLDLMLLKGNIFFHLGRHNGVISVLEKCSPWRPLDSQLAQQLAISFHARGQDFRAIRVLDRYINRWIGWRKRDHSQQASDSASSSHVLDYTCVNLLCELWSSQRAYSKIKSLIASLLPLLDQSDSLPMEIRFQYCIALIHLRESSIRLDPMIHSLLSDFELSLHNADLYYDLAEAYFECGQLSQALPIYEQLNTLNAAPNPNQLRARIAYCLSFQHQSRDALLRSAELYEEILLNSPPNPAEIQFALAALYSELKMPEKAAKMAREARSSIVQLELPDDYYAEQPDANQSLAASNRRKSGRSRFRHLTNPINEYFTPPNEIIEITSNPAHLRPDYPFPVADPTLKTPIFLLFPHEIPEFHLIPHESSLLNVASQSVEFLRHHDSYSWLRNLLQPLISHYLIAEGVQKLVGEGAMLRSHWQDHCHRLTLHPLFIDLTIEAIKQLIQLKFYRFAWEFACWIERRWVYHLPVPKEDAKRASQSDSVSRSATYWKFLQLRYYLFYLSFQRRQWPDAVEYGRLMLEAYPDSLEFGRAMVEVANRCGWTRRVYRAIENLIESCPDSAPVALFAGCASMNREAYKQAEQNFLRAKRRCKEFHQEKEIFYVNLLIGVAKLHYATKYAANSQRFQRARQRDMEWERMAAIEAGDGEEGEEKKRDDSAKKAEAPLDMQQVALRRNAEKLQAHLYLYDYMQKSREYNPTDEYLLNEAYYNLGRAFHFTGELHFAVHFYQACLRQEIAHAGEQAGQLRSVQAPDRSVLEQLDRDNELPALESDGNQFGFHDPFFEPLHFVLESLPEDERKGLSSSNPGDAELNSSFAHRHRGRKFQAAHNLAQIYLKSGNEDLAATIYEQYCSL